MSVTLDDTDRALLAALARNARMPATELARRLGIARTTVQARIDRLESGGVIKGYTVKTSVGPGAMIRAYVLVQAEPRRTAAVAAALQKMPEMESLHTTSGRFDLIVTLEAMTTEALDETLDRIGEAKGVNRSESLIHLATKLDRGP